VTSPLRLALVLTWPGLYHALPHEHGLLLLDDLGHVPHEALEALLVHLVAIC
jgi:hypothetical protein